MASKHDDLERKKKWRSHLQAENCVDIRTMLSDNGHDLLPVGWNQVDPKVPASPWRGRTALHVAVRRGDVELVEVILNIAYPLASASVASEWHGSEGSTKVNPDVQNHLLEVIHSDYQLDALGMAIVNGNNHIVNLLKGASLRCGWNPYDISHDRVDDEKMNRKLSAEDEDIKRIAKTLSEVTEAALLAVTQYDKWNQEITIEIMKAWYRESCDFNFIDIDRDMHLFFHSTFSAMSQVDQERKNAMNLIRKEIIFRASHIDGLLEFLLVTLKDGQGRTALHVAVDYRTVSEFLESLEVEVDKRKILNATDSLRRTPLYRAAAKSIISAMKSLLDDDSTVIHAEIKYEAKTWEDFGIDIDKVSWKNGFRSGCVFIPRQKLDKRCLKSESTSQDGRRISDLSTISCTALHVAIIHQNELVVKDILHKFKTCPQSRSASSSDSGKDDHSAIGRSPESGKDDYSDIASSPDCKRRFSWPVVKALQDPNSIYPTCQATTMKLSVLVGNVYILRKLLKAEERWAGTKYFDEQVNFPTFLLAAAMGNPAVVTAFLDCKGETISYTECDGLRNTALHHALSGSPVELRPHLLDFVGCHHAYSSRRNNDSSAEGKRAGTEYFDKQVKTEAEETSAAGTDYSDKKLNSPTKFPSFLLAAAMGNPAVVKAFLDRKGERISYKERDGLQNTALHHALRGRPIELHPHLLDFVGCHHVYSSRWNNDASVSQWLANPLMEEKKVQGNEEKSNWRDIADRSDVQKRGTIHLLLEAGIDIWAKNEAEMTASPDPAAGKDFAEWWYDKVAEETKEEQTTLNDAANAISVTAALVATASYVGPATPPLGLNDEHALQLNILAVRIFVVCDSLSFYFALAAIMLALLPALPLKNPSMFTELKRRRGLVAGAVSFLFPSIICVLVAFATGYVAASPDHGLTHHGVTVGSTVVGAFCCLVVITMFFRRWVAVLGDQLKGTRFGAAAFEKSKQLAGRTKQGKYMKYFRDLIQSDIQTNRFT